MPDLPLSCHTGEGRCLSGQWIPACAGKTQKYVPLDGGPSFAEVLYIRCARQRKSLEPEQLVAANRVVLVIRPGGSPCLSAFPTSSAALCKPFAIWRNASSGRGRSNTWTAVSRGRT